MKEYKLKFGVYAAKNEWHVARSLMPNIYSSDCKIYFYFGNKDAKNNFLHPLSDFHTKGHLKTKPLHYDLMCKLCLKKFKLTQEDINHYIVLAKFGIKI